MITGVVAAEAAVHNVAMSGCRRLQVSDYEASRSKIRNVRQLTGRTIRHGVFVQEVEPVQNRLTH